MHVAYDREVAGPAHVVHEDRVLVLVVRRKMGCEEFVGPDPSEQVQPRGLDVVLPVVVALQKHEVGDELLRVVRPGKLRPGHALFVSAAAEVADMDEQVAGLGALVGLRDQPRAHVFDVAEGTV